MQENKITINLFPESYIDKLLIENQTGKVKLDNFLSQLLPKRFARFGVIHTSNLSL